jgi:hypothetical protein
MPSTQATSLKHNDANTCCDGGIVYGILGNNNLGYLKIVFLIFPNLYNISPENRSLIY